MKAQISIEYIFAVFAWVFICTSFAFVANSYVSGFSSASLGAANSASIQKVSEIAGSDLDGLKYQQVNYIVEGNMTFNYTIASLRTSSAEYLASSGMQYSYSDNIMEGDRFLIKNQGGFASVEKVS